jgi:hypothetical protein
MTHNLIQTWNEVQVAVEWLGLWWAFHPPLRRRTNTGWHPWT